MKAFMKTFLVLCAAAGLTGCAVYPSPGYDTYGYDTYRNAGPAPYVVEQPTYLYGGGTVYRSDSYPYQRPWGYSRSPSPPPVIVVPGPRTGRPFVQGPRYGGDRDGDGIPNRVDRDRDGDGIANRRDRDRNNNGVPNRVDRDGDGIANRVERDRNNNGVPNRMERSRDRDGDGISNRMDPRPDIPNRR